MIKLITSSKYVIGAGLLAVGMILAVPAASVHADTPTPGAPVPQVAEAGRVIRNQLDRVFSRQGEQLGKQATRLQNASKVIDRAQKRIDALKQKGMDITALESALAAFKQGAAAAQSEHNQAASIHSTAAGFDTMGKVTDINQAIQTAHSTQDHLTACRHGLEDAFRQMFWAVMQARISLLGTNTTHY